MLSLSAFVHGIILLIVAGLVFWLLWWLISYVGIPEPFHKIATVLLAVGAVLVCIHVLLGLAGVQVFEP